MISPNIWFHLTWQMMLDIIVCITFLPVPSKYQATRLICHNFEMKRYIDNQKVRVADEKKRDISIYVVLSDVADDA